jgi:polygalacturonase
MGVYPNGQLNRGNNAAGILGWINALDEGVVGDGKVNDAPALNSLLSALSGGIGGTLVLPPGTYFLSSNVTVPSTTALLVAAGASLTGAGLIVTSGTGTIVDLRTGLAVTGTLGASGVTGALTAGRLALSGGTSVVAGDFALSAGWGTTASVSAVSGDDSRGTVTVTSSGTGQGANPTITFTFHDLAFAVAPFAIVQAAGGTGTWAGLVAVRWSSTTLALTITPLFTPVAGSTYQFSWVLID